MLIFNRKYFGKKRKKNLIRMCEEWLQTSIKKNYNEGNKLENVFEDFLKALPKDPMKELVFNMKNKRKRKKFFKINM